MAMYIAKPWYKNNETKQTTTFLTKSESRVINMFEDTPLDRRDYFHYLFNNYPRMSKVTTYTSSTNASGTVDGTRYSYTVSYPNISYKDILPSDSSVNNIYNRYSTNMTNIPMTSSDATCSSTYQYLVSGGWQSTLHTYRTTFGQRYYCFDGKVTCFNDTRNYLLDFALSKIGTATNYVRIYNSDLVSLTGRLHNADQNITNTSNYPQLMIYRRYLYFGTTSYRGSSVTNVIDNLGDVAFAISDPYKITVRLNTKLYSESCNTYYSTSYYHNNTYSNGDVIMYRATLTELPA